MKQPRKIMIIAILILLPAIFSFAGLYHYIVTFGTVADKGDADVIIVLGAAVWPDGPSPALRARTWRGSSLYHEGRADYLLFSGGIGKFPPAEAEVMAALAQSWDVEPERILLEDRSANTRENLRNAAEIMEEKGWSRAYIVTDYFHMKRAMALAAEFGIEALRAPVSVERTHYAPGERLRYTLRECIAVIHHYLTKPFRDTGTGLLSTLTARLQYTPKV
ncbi:MAG: YdcF family protein [Bacillota bacterium]|nr:YdcF family protein [Bacillota bacterium]MDW7683129.1 YdcF family protein [Bacillota bacterium]